MPKVCDECGGKHYAKGKCALHYRMPSQLNPKPIQRVAIKKPVANEILLGGKWVGVKTAIKQVSDKRAKELRIYEKNKVEYFKEYPVCQFPGCECREVTLHHSKGRIGSLLTDKRYFKSLCPEHHTFCENNPEEAKRLQLSSSRLETEKSSNYFSD